MNELHRSKAAHRCCPVCDGDSARFIMRQSFVNEGATTPLAGYDVVTCAGCGAGYALDIPPQEQLDAYYRELSKYEYEHRHGHESEEDERRLVEVARILCELIPTRTSRILEVGCGNGRLLALLREHGFENVKGVDPSRTCASNAQQLYGVEVINGTLSDLRALGARFDVVIMTQVLEHVRDLRVALRQVAEVLTDGGTFYADVPDVAGFTARTDAPFQEFSVEHINYFSRLSLRNVMTECSFGTVMCESGLREHRIGAQFPVVHGLFRRTSSVKSELLYDDITEPALRRYVKECRAVDEQLRARIKQQVVACEAILVWGTGTHTQRLLASGLLDVCNIAAFIDSNPKYQGHMLNGRPVLSPTALAERNEPIMISSFGFQREILEQIKTLKIKNRVITLYESSERHEHFAV